MFVPVIDETADVKGTATSAARRQYTGTAGRIDNSRRSALALPTRLDCGPSTFDRAAHLPKSGTEDVRSIGLGVPVDFELHTTRPRGPDAYPVRRAGTPRWLAVILRTAPTAHHRARRGEGCVRGRSRRHLTACPWYSWALIAIGVAVGRLSSPDA